MAHTKSAMKRNRTSQVKRDANRSAKSAIATLRRRLYEAVAAGNRSVADATFPEYFSALDKAVKRGILKHNTADRKKSRASAQLAILAAAPKA